MTLPRATFDFAEETSYGQARKTSYGVAVDRPQPEPDYLLKAVRDCQVTLCPWLSRTAHKRLGRDLSQALNLLKKVELALEADGNRND